MATINTNRASSISAPTQYSPIKGKDNHLSGTDIGTPESSKEQVTLVSTKEEIENMGTKSDSGTVNEKSASNGGSGFGSLLDFLLNAVSSIINSSSSSSSSSPEDKKDTKENSIWITEAINSAIISATSGNSILKDFKATASKNITDTSDPFNAFILKIGDIFSEINSYLGGNLEESAKNKIISSLDTKSFLKQLASLSSEYKTIKSGNSSTLMSSISSSVVSSINSSAAEIAAAATEASQIKAYNEAVRIQKDKYAVKVAQDQVDNLRRNPTEDKTSGSSVSEYDTLMNMLRSSS